MKTYFVMDGRAAFDVDSASVIEAFEAVHDKSAKKYARKNWDGHDYVVVDNEMNVVY